jgi:hypothetical protein
MSSPLFRHLRTVAVVCGALVILLALVHWGGTASGGPTFVLGVAVYAGLIVTFGALGWWLLFSPLPDGAQPDTRRDPATRQLMAILVLIGVALYAGGFFWDEVWHRIYGTFGNDFLWPPHFLIYASLALIAGFAGYGLRFVVVGGQGGLRQRIRKEPLVALLGLTALFLAMSAPSDEVWHRIYGKDITAWSLPHLSLLGGSALVALAGVSLQLSILPRQAWGSLRGLRRQEWIAIGLIALATILIVQIGTTEWEGMSSPDSAASSQFLGPFWQRPEWLYPVVVVSIGLFFGALTLHALRRAGAATLVGLLVLGFRALALAAIGLEATTRGLGVVSHALLIPPMIALDVWYAVRRQQPDSLTTLIGGNLLAGVVFLIVGLPVINATLNYPRINGDTLPGMIGFGLLMALAAGWAGARLGRWLGTLDRQPEAAPIGLRVLRMSIGALAVAVALAVLIIFTAKPPVT